jgi:hypothetical protein
MTAGKGPKPGVEPAVEIVVGLEFVAQVVVTLEREPHLLPREQAVRGIAALESLEAARQDLLTRLAQLGAGRRAS